MTAGRNARGNEGRSGGGARLRPRKVRAADRGEPEIHNVVLALLQVCAGEVDVRHVGVCHLGAVEVGARAVGVGQREPAARVARELAESKDRPDSRAALEVCPEGLDEREVGVVQNGLAEVCRDDPVALVRVATGRKGRVEGRGPAPLRSASPT